MNTEEKKLALVTGAAGFIGFHISKRLLEQGWRVIGLDCLSDYYDVSLKNERENILLNSDSYHSIHEHVETKNFLTKLFAEKRPDVVIHLAAQAGVRYSLENPRAYLDSNIVGTFELLEAARNYPPSHMLLASTSSAYGANKDMPYLEKVKADNQMSFYAATKKATENMAHSYSHLYKIPITMFRFFTVYGPWGRPDMALFKFTKAILNGEPIDVYNNGDMSRDFTYIDDLVDSIYLLIDAVPLSTSLEKTSPDLFDKQSPVAPFRVINIGNAKPEKLNDFIEALEFSLGVKAKKNLLPMQAGDVPSTWADTSLLKHLTGYSPRTNIYKGIDFFVKWYRDYYKVKF